MLKTALWFFLAGLIISIVLEAVWRMVGYYSPSGYTIERIARFLWPSSVFKRVLDQDRDSGLQVALVYSLSVVANGVLYGLLGLLIGLARNFTARTL